MPFSRIIDVKHFLLHTPMSLSLLKPQSLNKIKWLRVQPEPTNSSLIAALLPDDVLLEIVRLSAETDTASALTLAVCSKAVGRAAETVLYASVTLSSISAIRTFCSTLRSKSRHILAVLRRLTLRIPTPPLFDDFWALVGARCPRLAHLTVCDAEIAALLRPGLRVRPTRLTLLADPARGSKLRESVLFFATRYGVGFAGPVVPELDEIVRRVLGADPDPDPALYSRLTHVHIASAWPDAGWYTVPAVFALLRARPAQLRQVTHVALRGTGGEMVAGVWEDVRRLPALRVAVFALPPYRGGWTETGPRDPRFVAFGAGDVDLDDDGDGDGEESPHWAWAERKIEERRQKAVDSSQKPTPANRSEAGPSH
ncbi:hypothetical protein MIND_01340300 [Mycena indigotica]|uniref:Uncharacterized protein n=1 Tax=Mycena indigotica TaxID=2126181 RepID=A0A8H6S117_9AGAR|nr:uncharacterized protein MIND_01340300 [Mycena indigotica]KAF7290265.1 hypothetical protein MIND_01340300 [Mycena indigotica]